MNCNEFILFPVAISQLLLINILPKAFLAPFYFDLKLEDNALHWD